jgi:hypothetical protein
VLNPNAFDAAADLIERYGWTQGKFYDDRRTCLVGAIYFANFADRETAWAVHAKKITSGETCFDDELRAMVATVIKTIRRHQHVYPGQGILTHLHSVTDWNDSLSEGTGASIVVRALRQTAAELRANQDQAELVGA